MIYFVLIVVGKLDIPFGGDFMCESQLGGNIFDIRIMSSSSLEVQMKVCLFTLPKFEYHDLFLSCCGSDSEMHSFCWKGLSYFDTRHGKEIQQMTESLKLIFVLLICLRASFLSDKLLLLICCQIFFSV